MHRRSPQAPTPMSTSTRKSPPRPAIFVLAMSALLATSYVVRAGTVTVDLSTPEAPPDWALLERELLRANADACREFYHKYFDARGFLLCVEHWGGDDGPDDAIENLNDWP